MQISFNTFNTNNYRQKSTTFKSSAGLKNLRNISLALTSSLMLLSCGHKTDKTITNDVVEISSKSEINDSVYAIEKEVESNGKNVKKCYYYPTEKAVNAEDYNWSETIFPDGKVEKDSMGYKITITPDGKRTSIKAETDEFGHTTTTTEMPDGTKVIKTDYKLQNPNEILYTIKTLRPNGSLKNSKYYNKYPADSTAANLKIVEESFEEYNENNILLRWFSTVKDEARCEDNNEYDSQKRLIYDDVKNETYMYQGTSTIPYQSVSEYEDCKRITEYNQDGSVNKIYFKASDGTTTGIDDNL